MKEVELKPCPFCGCGAIYNITREDEIVGDIPQLFCNGCKMTFEVENDSPYMSDRETFNYLKEKLYETWNRRAEEYAPDINVGNNDGWIPCSKRLPENTDNVIITTVYGVVLMAFIATNKKWCYLNGKRIIDSQDAPIAWQPLPAPYKPKGE